MERETSARKAKRKIEMIISPRLNMNELMVKTSAGDFEYFTKGKLALQEQKPFSFTGSKEIKDNCEGTNLAELTSTFANAAHLAQLNTPETSPLSQAEDNGPKQNGKGGSRNTINPFHDGLELPHLASTARVNPECELEQDKKMTKDIDDCRLVLVPQEVEVEQFKSFSCFSTPRLDPNSKLDSEVEGLKEPIAMNTNKQYGETPKKLTRNSFRRKQINTFNGGPSIPTVKKRLAKGFIPKGYQPMRLIGNSHLHESGGFRGSQVFASQTQSQVHEDDIISFVVARNRLFADSKIDKGNVVKASNLELSSRHRLAKPVKLRRLNQTGLHDTVDLLEPPKKYTYTLPVNDSLNSAYTNSIDTSTFTNIVEVPETPHTLVPQVSAASTDSLISNFLHLQVSTPHTQAPIVKRSTLKLYISRIKKLPKVLHRDHHIVYNFGPISLPKLRGTSQIQFTQLQNEKYHHSESMEIMDKTPRIQTRRNFTKHAFRSSTLGIKVYEDDRTRLKRLFNESESLESAVQLFEKYLDVSIK